MKAIIGDGLIALAIMPVHAAEDRESATNILSYCIDRDVAGCAEVIRRLTALMVMPAEDRESAANVLLYCKLNLTLKDVLGDTYNARMYARCAGFVFHMGMKREQLQVTPPVNCIFLPHDVNGKQLVDAMIKYADARPKELDRPFIAFARDALANEWPCK